MHDTSTDFYFALLSHPVFSRWNEWFWNFKFLNVGITCRLIFGGFLSVTGHNQTKKSHHLTTTEAKQIPGLSLNTVWRRVWLPGRTSLGRWCTERRPPDLTGPSGWGTPGVEEGKCRRCWSGRRGQTRLSWWRQGRHSRTRSRRWGDRFCWWIGSKAIWRGTKKCKFKFNRPVSFFLKGLAEISLDQNLHQLFNFWRFGRKFPFNYLAALIENCHKLLKLLEMGYFI